MKILYVHGYNGSAEGGSYRLLKKHRPEGAEIFGMDYCQDDCAVALEQIRETVRKKDIDVVVGSSLGGFLTILTEGIERYAINPCYHPSVELPQLGPQNGLPAPLPKMTATYEAFESRLKQLVDSDKTRLHVLMADRDELLGDRYWDEIQEDTGGKPGMLFSTHHLSESAAETIGCLMAGGKSMLDDAHKYARAHEYMIARSETCGCFSCGRIFPSCEIEDWMKDEDGRTAICPHCFVDAILPEVCPYPLTHGFLEKMRKRWF